MKKILYILFTCTIAYTAAAQSPTHSTILESKEALGDFMMLENKFLLYTLKENGGQYIYTERWVDWDRVSQKESLLNTGKVNAVIGHSADESEIYVYQNSGRNHASISFFSVTDSTFTKVGQRALPKLKKRLSHLDLFLSGDKNTLIIAAKLGKSRGHEDLYVSSSENNQWTNPKSLGRELNTVAAEFAPFATADSVYFSRKEAGGAYIYGAAFQNNQLKGVPAKLKQKNNIPDNFNAYYKKLGVQNYWVSRDTTGAYKLNQNDDYWGSSGFEGLQEEGFSFVNTSDEVFQVDFVSTDQHPDMAYELDRMEAEKTDMVTEQSPTELTIHYILNQTAITSIQGTELNKFLDKLADGTAIKIKGFSDGSELETAKLSVSLERAQLLKSYIQQNFEHKKLKITLETKVKKEEAAYFRIAEIRVTD